MPIFGFKMTYSGFAAEPKRVFNEGAKWAFGQVGLFWHRKLRLKHFTPAGAREYRYQPRKGQTGNAHPFGFRRSYTGIKLRTHGHTNPLEFSGETKALSAAARIVATSKGVRVSYPALRKLNFRNPHSKIRMADEYRNVSDAETRKIEKLHARSLELRFGKTRLVRTVKG